MWITLGFNLYMLFRYLKTISNEILSSYFIKINEFKLLILELLSTPDIVINL